MSTPQKRRHIVDTYTCSRCKTTIEFDLSGYTNEAIGAGVSDKESSDFFRKSGWVEILHLVPESVVILCPECCSDTQTFVTNRASKCPLYDLHCSEHDFFHGAEASELREGIEALLRDSDAKEGPDFRRLLQQLLERVDARDSLAYEEHVKNDGGV